MRLTVTSIRPCVRSPFAIPLAEFIATASRLVFTRIIDLCLEEKVQALLLAGDLYDGDQTSMKTARFLGVVDEVGGVVTEADGGAALLLPLHAAASSTSASSPLRRTGRRYEMGGNYVK